MKSSGGGFDRVQPAMAYAAAHLDEDLRLAALSARTSLSAFHMHRVFATVAGETPKEYTLRLRLNAAAAHLVGSRDSILRIALSCGFASPEAFARAFKREFRLSPRQYRARGFAAGAAASDAAAHVAATRRIGPCVRLFHVQPDEPSSRSDMAYSIDKRQLDPQSVLLVRRRIKRSEIASTIGEALSSIFQYAQQHGVALTGHPFTRYADVGAGLMTIEPGMRVVGGGKRPDSSTQAPSGDASTVVEDTLPGGVAAVTTHSGPYDTLSDAYAALESWIESNGFAKRGAPWESYVTDPAEHPDPKDWRTEVCWPIQ
jgi:AraC family transcriptional regulator